MKTLKEILTEEISAELEKKQALDNKVIVPSLIKKRAIITVLFSVIGIIFSGITPWLSLAAAVIGALLVLCSNNKKELMNIAKKNPDTDFAKIVRENTSSFYTSKERLDIVACVIAIGLFVFVVVNSHLITSEKYTPYNSGYKLDRYVQAFYDNTKEYEIPETYKGKPVIAIDDKAFFKNKKVESVIVPDTVKEIGSGVFKECTNLRTVSLGRGVKTMGGECFMNCKSLMSITIPERVTEIRGNSFEGCSKLISVKLHDNIEAIHGSAFLNCTSLRAITLPSGITEIRGNTFEGCSKLYSIVIPDGVTRIAAHAFYGCSSLTEVVVPDSVTEIGSSAFRYCTSLHNIEIPATAYVNERAFKDSPTGINVRKQPSQNS